MALSAAVKPAETGKGVPARTTSTKIDAQQERLVDTEPGAFLPDLARSLSNLSNGLGVSGRREAGLAAITEAVEIHRRLVEAEPDAFLPDLARSLHNLSIRLGKLGR